MSPRGVLLDALIRRQRRRNHRVRLGLVTCLFQEIEGVLVDPSTGGAGISLRCHRDAVPEAGAVTTLAFRVPDTAGSWRNVSTLIHVAYVNSGLPGETKIGLTFDDPTTQRAEHESPDLRPGEAKARRRLAQPGPGARSG